MNRRTIQHSIRLFLLILLVVGIGKSQAQTTDSTVVILLGTGTPVPDPSASGPSTAIVVQDRIFVVDAGPGVMRRLTAAGLPRNRITALFLSHLHSDHTLGYPDLLLSTWTVGRRTPFSVYGPKGTKRMTEKILEAWSEDITVRVNGLERNSPGGFAVRVHEIDDNVIYDSAGVTVTAFRVSHGNWKEAFGFRFETPGKVVVISGDTAPDDNVIQAARGADILIHEAYPSVRLAPEDRPGGELWPEYMRTFHTSDVEVGRIAFRAKPALLILHHVVWMGGTEKELREGVLEGGFLGRTVIGKDLERY
jgi:ribonuclease Z